MADYKPCNKCKKDIFFLDHGNGFLPFDAEVTDIPKGKRYADGYDKVKTADKDNIRGFRLHFDTCGKGSSK
jgi:hypothetical protein